MSKLKETINVVKVSGKVLDEQALLERFVYEFSGKDGMNILVHGGGVGADKIMKSLDMPVTKVEGKRVTDQSAIGAIIMAFTLLNKQIVDMLNDVNVETNVEYVGLPDVRTIAESNKMAPKEVKGSTVDYGFVGIPSRQAAFGDVFPAGGVIPVFSPITFDKTTGLLLNTNADDIASALAISFADEYDVNLIFVSDVAGVWDQNKIIIPSVNGSNYQALKDSGAITDGMIPKLEGAFAAIDNGVSCVQITNALRNVGTLITR
jgi:acetylglutamate kinase